jgi:CheY-like chemotaxis protein
MAQRKLPQVLVVDDDGAHRLMLKTMLKEWKY